MVVRALFIILLCYTFRHRLFDSPEISSDSDFDDNSLASDDSPLHYYENDPELPIFRRTTVSYGLTQLVNILMDDSLDDQKVCKVQPLGVVKNCTFIIDIDSVSIDDLRADDLGAWKPTGTRRSYFILDENNEPDSLSQAPSSGASYFVVIRRYFVHMTYSKFRRIIVEIQGKIMQDYMHNNT